MKLLEAIQEHRIVVALRGVPLEQMADVALALGAGGVKMLEITFDQSDANRMQNTQRAIRAVREAVDDDLLVGAGTVMSVDEVEAAKEAGATYMLSPNLDQDVLRRAKELGMGAIPGAMTPTEVAAAYAGGADLVKLFPCDVLGLAYIRALKAPISHVPILAMGGVNAQNLCDYLQVVEGVGVGSAIVDKVLVRNRDYAGLTELAKRFTGQIRE